jgi:hypothetical protein
MEHGLDARHAGVHQQGPGAPALSPRPAHLRPAVRLHGELRAALLARRGGARQVSCCTRCPATSGSSSPICACSTPTCGPIPARSCCSWARKPLEWPALEYAPHVGVRNLVRDLNRLYRDEPALHHYEFEPKGFDWIDCHDAAQSVISYQRRADDTFIVATFNFTPVVRASYRLGVPEPGRYRVLLNSDSSFYGGSNTGEQILHTEPTPWMGHPCSIVLTLPPLAGVILKREA